MNRSKLFKAAWVAARRGVATFGGSPRQYFRLALVYAWEAAKAPKPADHGWHESRPAPYLTQEQRDRIRVQAETDLAQLIAFTKAAGIVRGGSHAGAWMGR